MTSSEMEVLALDCDNTIDLLLKADGVAVDLSSVTRIDAVFSSTVTVSSTNGNTGPIKWLPAAYDTGEIRIDLSDSDEASLTVGIYNVKIIVYDATWTDGVYWGNVITEVIDPK
jgi:hypothetical protein